MKILCVYHKTADKFLGKKINWNVCQECQRMLRRGIRPVSVLFPVSFSEVIADLFKVPSHMLGSQKP